MATIQRNLACEEYAKGYIELTDTRKNTFSRLCNKLLNDNFIYAYKQDDRNDYYEILNIGGFYKGYIYLYTDQAFYKLKLSNNKLTKFAKFNNCNSSKALFFSSLVKDDDVNLSCSSLIVVSIFSFLLTLNATNLSFSLTLTSTVLLTSLVLLSLNISLGSVI